MKKVISLVMVFMLMSSVFVTAQRDGDDTKCCPQPKTYSVTAISNPSEVNATFNGTGDNFKYYDRVHITVDSDSYDNTKYTFKGFKVPGWNGLHNEVEGWVESDTEVVAHFDVKGYYVTATSDTPGAGATFTGVRFYNKDHHNYSVTVSFDEANYTFDGWTPGQQTSKTFDGHNNTCNDVALVAHFTPIIHTYEVTAVSSPDVGVTFTGTGSYPQTENYNVDIVYPASFDALTYELDHWNPSNSGSYPNHDVALTAYFKMKEYTVSATSSPDVGATFLGTGTTFKQGGPYNVTIVADSYDDTMYHFDGWSPTNEGIINGADVELVANFSKIYDVTATGDPVAANAVFTGEATGLINGSEFTVTLVSYDELNYRFENWCCPLGTSVSGQTVTGTIDEADVDLYAYFLDLYSVTVVTNISGTGAVFSGEGSNFVAGDEYDVDLLSFDTENYTFSGFTPSDTGMIEESDVVITANFRLIPPIPEGYAVRVTPNIAGTGAIFSGYGTGFYDGDTYNVKLESYDSVGFQFNGFSPSNNGTIAGSDVDLIANFSEIIPDPTFTVTASGNIADANAVFAGTASGLANGDAYNVELTTYDSVNYSFIGWSESPTGNIASADVALVANFEAIVEEEEVPEELPVVPEEPKQEEVFDIEPVPEDLPLALPETGGLPMAAFSLSGIALTGLGIVLKRKNK